jgi:hypothetical protein
MRCLARLITLIVLALLVAGAWIYRDNLRRMVHQTLGTAPVVSPVGRPSPAALASARHKLDSLQNSRRDSVRLTPNEAASLLASGTSVLPGSTFDSISIELGDRTLRVRTLVDSARIAARLRAFIPGTPSRYEEVVVRGTLTPVRAGLGEFDVEHVSLHGIPLPVDVVARLVQASTGRTQGTTINVVLPQIVGGFRVHPDGVTVYRDGGRP